MRYIQVKGMEKPVSRLIMGTAWLRAEEEELAHELFDLFTANGGNMIDTGRYYGKGTGIAQAEGIVARWLHKGDNRQKVYVMDKCCHPFIGKDGRMRNERWRVSPEFMEEDLLYSLDNMGLDYFDIYELHRDDPGVPVPVLMDQFESFYRNGLIKAYGVSNWQQDRVAEALEYCSRMGYRGLSCNNPSYSLATVRVSRWVGCIYADDAYARWHKDKGLALFSWGAQGAGFFAGIYGEDASANIKEAYFTEENFEKLARCRELGEKKGVDSINIALAYILNQEFPVAAVIGPQSAKELESCIAGGDLLLTRQEVDYLALRADSY